MLRKTCLLLLVLILIPGISHAKTETIFADHKSVMGDNDSKNDARRMCFLEAKRKVLEKAGTYIESHTQAKNYKLTKDEINSYASALLKVETVKEEWKFVGENMAVFMTVKADVDTGYVEKQLAEIKKDASVQKKIKDQQAQIQELERRFFDLQKQLGAADSSKALPLRKERKEVFKEIDDIETRHKNVIGNLELPKRKAASVKLAKRILAYVETNMTPEEVKYILGEPDTESEYKLEYGDFNIHFTNDGKLYLMKRISFDIGWHYKAVKLTGQYRFRKLEMAQDGEKTYTIKSGEYNILKHGIRNERKQHGWDELQNNELKRIKEYVLGE